MNVLSVFELSSTDSPHGKKDECAKFDIFDTAEWFILSDTMTVGLMYTFSAWIKSGSEGSLTVGESYTKTSTDWKRYKFTFTADDTDLKLIFSTPGTYYLYNSQLEIGNVATDWTEAPEDTEANIEATTTSIKQDATKIVLEAEGRFSEKLGDYYTKKDAKAYIEVKLGEIRTYVGEEIESITFGGRNMLLKSNPNLTSAVFGMKNFDFGTSKPVVGETYTVTIKGQLGTDRTKFAVYNSGNKVKFTDLTDNGNGLYVGIAEWKNTDGSDTASDKYVRVFQFPETGTSESTIEWIKMEMGNKASSDWSPAPEDYTDAFGNYYTIQQTNSLINQTATEISNTVNTRIETIGVGGRNLLTESRPDMSTDVFGMKNFYFGESKPIEDETYTVTIKGQLGADRTKFSVYNSGNDVKFADLTATGIGTYTATGKWKITSGSDTASNEYLRVFHFPETGATTKSSIEWIKLEKGSQCTDWTPAPEDVDDDIAAVGEVAHTVTTSFSNFTIAQNSINSTVSTTKEQIDGIDGRVKSVEKQTTKFQQTSEGFTALVQSLNDTGVAKVTTTTGVFDENGLTIDKSDSPTETTITPDGMTVYKKESNGDKTAVLEATSDGVNATNLSATTYLIVGGRSRFENYGNKRTGCFWIGG